MTRGPAPDPERVREAIRTLQDELGDPESFELHYHQYNDEAYVTLGCPEPIPGVPESPLGEYRLDTVELGGTERSSVEPKELPVGEH